jgi:peptide/nickel transport system ATP-binding protein
VDTVSLCVRQGETLAIVGESGCGKTVLALSVLGLIPDPPGRVVAGEALYRGRDLLAMSEAELQTVRGRHIAMIFQEPMTSLNPVFRVGEQVAEGCRLHLGLSRTDAAERAVEMLAQVGIPNPRERARSYPHELSGGMRQRVMIAMALACGPDLVFADEPTTALDVTIQAQILDLLRALQREKGAGVALITHDLGVVAETASRVAVMYAGQVVEEADVAELYAHPAHPYAKGLLASVPRLGVKRVLAPIPGMVPGIFNLPEGCRFRPRCPRAFERCMDAPPLFQAAPGHSARCWLCEGNAK